MKEWPENHNYKMSETKESLVAEITAEVMLQNSLFRILSLPQSLLDTARNDFHCHRMAQL